MVAADGFDVALLACRPVVVTRDYPTDVPIPDPHAGSTVVPCEACGAEVYLGPAQGGAKEELGDKAIVACFLCALLIANSNGSAAIRSLTNKVTPARFVEHND